jgi:C4-dicarboxylate transporter, DctQ subunit
VLKKGSFHLVEKAVNGLTYATGLLSGFCALGMAFIVTYDVLMRFLFSRPTLWVFETSEYLLIVIVFCGASYCLLKEGHVHVDLITNLYSSRRRSISKAMTSVFGFLFCAIFAREAWKYWWVAYQKDWKSSSLLEFPLVYPYFFMAAGLTILTLQYIVKVISYFADIKARDPQEGKR